MTEGKYTGLREVLNHPLPIGVDPYPTPVSFTLDLIRELLAERDTLVKERDELVKDKQALHQVITAMDEILLKSAEALLGERD